MKIVREGALPVGGESGLLDVRDRAIAAAWGARGRGEIQPADIWREVVARVLGFVDLSALRPLRVVVDAANGMAGTMLPPVLERLPMLDVVRCNFEPDGAFPNHEPNPLRPENREFIVARTREEGADFGVAFDGDADRCFFVDDGGEFVPGDFTTALSRTPSPLELRGRSSNTTSGPRTSTGSCRLWTCPRSARFASSSTPQTEWPD